ncbi:hypothetical protein ACE3MZ_08410 [Paenibacillus sp. WLX1005]|uniref:hypothetical protein n=1 Tax=Paenibacillus sp. WLX1005 TaxID=3243766 RepID=UPI003983EF41
MEKESITNDMSEDAICQLIQQASVQPNAAAMEKLLRLFEPDMIQFARYIRMPSEDALQALKLALIELVLSGF